MNQPSAHTKETKCGTSSRILLLPDQFYITCSIASHESTLPSILKTRPEQTVFRDLLQTGEQLYILKAANVIATICWTVRPIQRAAHL
jgi:hypothetical protein